MGSSLLVKFFSFQPLNIHYQFMLVAAPVK